MGISTKEWIRRAYKKLKGAVYFDKTQLPLVDKLVAFEREPFEIEFDRLAELLDNAQNSSDSTDKWEDYVADRLATIDVLVYPKVLKSWNDSQIIFNADDEPIQMKKAQYFIDIDVMGHILGVLWVLTVGVKLDDQSDPDHLSMYEHSYGNRLRNKLLDPETGGPTYSPYLFQPYFSQYQHWRDTALDYAKERLDAKQDALILMLDLRSFFYSVDISKERFDTILQDIDMQELPQWTVFLHRYVYRVMAEYSNKVRVIHEDKELPLEKRVFLPIGFLPSNILSNWILTPLDNAINDRINPVYYGRYVDDIIIVDKVEKNSVLQRKARGRSENKDAKTPAKLTTRDVIEYYFDSGFSLDKSKGSLPLLVDSDEMKPNQKNRDDLDEIVNDDQKTGTVYRLNYDAISEGQYAEEHPNIQVQNDKVKVFYFREGSTRALLDCFRREIGSNVSEFRYLPDMEHALGENDYSEIYKLENSETPNKLRGVDDVHLDKFALSKFLGKYRKVGNLIQDKKENAFDRDLLSIFNQRLIIENYTLWERLLEIMVVNNRIDSFEKMAKTMLKSIKNYEVPTTLLNTTEEGIGKKALLLTLYSAICRTSALCWGKKMTNALRGIEKEANKLFKALPFSLDDFTDQRIAYLRSCMVNRYILPLPTEWINLERLDRDDADKEICLCSMQDFISQCSWMTSYYSYYPYMRTPQEISYALTCYTIENTAESLRKNENQQAVEETSKLLHPDELKENVNKYYKLLNYGKLDGEKTDEGVPDIETLMVQNLPDNCYAVSVASPKTKTIRIAIGNAKLKKTDFKHALTGKPNRSYERYQQFFRLYKEALLEKTDILVLPESYLPWEWVPDVTRLCATNGMALITGIEPVVSQNTQEVFNLTAVILPYKQDEYKFAHVIFHHKVHYSPEEKHSIHGYDLSVNEGSDYHLFCWKDLWFSVYCCFELASIKDRARFQSLADMTVAVEWNKDISYYSSIIESLCRDLHCYCVQVNSSDYGDSRIIKPSKTVEKDILKTKGGINHTILVGEINVEELRDFQRKGYELQRDDARFKPTPPDFKPTVIAHKQSGTLLEYLKSEFEERR